MDDPRVNKVIEQFHAEARELTDALNCMLAGRSSMVIAIAATVLVNGVCRLEGKHFSEVVQALQRELNSIPDETIEEQLAKARGAAQG